VRAEHCIVRVRLKLHSLASIDVHDVMIHSQVFPLGVWENGRANLGEGPILGFNEGFGTIWR
jgi:hypothetical protein